MEKLTVGDQVAVLISYGYGAGWSTWNSEYAEQMLFDPKIVEMLSDNALSSEIENYCETNYPGGYFGGLNGLTVEFVPKGSEFRVEEYDGAESLMLKEEYRWYKA